MLYLPFIPVTDVESYKQILKCRRHETVWDSTEDVNIKPVIKLS